MKTLEKKNWGRKAVTIMVLVLLVILSAVNLKIVKVPLEKFIKKESDFEGFADEIQKSYLSDSFDHKNDFVNVNGFFAKLTGRRVLNNVVKLNNGMLGRTLGHVDTVPLANGISEFSDYLSEKDIPFLYIQIPVKESLDGKSYPVGVNFYGNKNSDSILSQLSACGVNTLDLRPFISQTSEMLEQYFSKTDHHWNSDGAFVAFQEILNRLNQSLPEANIDMTYAQADHWERHSLNNWFLGSLGKRVGNFFGGTDPLIWYTPVFETEMSFSVPEKAMFYRGDFSKANIRTMYIEDKDYFRYDAYCVYIGTNYSLGQHRNLNAPSPLKVLMIKDSFSLPLEAYLSTVFQEVDALDPRAFTDCTFAEYVERAKPDIVILAMNPSVFVNEEYQNFGIEKELLMGSEGSTYETVAQMDIKVEAKDDKNNCKAYSLESNTVYRVSFADVDVLEGHTDGLGLRLYNKTAKKVLENTILDIAYCEAANDFSWTFRTPQTQDKLELLFYAGIYGSTAENSVTYRNVTLERLCNDDT